MWRKISAKAGLVFIVLLIGQPAQSQTPSTSPDNAALLRRAAAQLESARDERAVLDAVAVLAAAQGQERDSLLLQRLRGDATPLVREAAALALANSLSPESLPQLRAALASESEPGPRYAIQQAIAASESRQGLNTEGLVLRFTSTPLQRPGETATATLEVESTQAEAFARLTIHLPPGVTRVSGDLRWWGMIRRGERRRLDVQYTTSTNAGFHLRANGWLKLFDGQTFKGGHRSQTEILYVTPGRTVAPVNASTVEGRP